MNNNIILGKEKKYFLKNVFFFKFVAVEKLKFSGTPRKKPYAAPFYAQIGADN